MNGGWRDDLTHSAIFAESGVIFLRIGTAGTDLGASGGGFGLVCGSPARLELSMAAAVARDACRQSG